MDLLLQSGWSYTASRIAFLIRVVKGLPDVVYVYYTCWTLAVEILTYSSRTLKLNNLNHPFPIHTMYGVNISYPGVQGRALVPVAQRTFSSIREPPGFGSDLLVSRRNCSC